MHWFFTLLISLLVIFAIILAKYSYNVITIKKRYAHIPQADPDRKENFFFGLANEELTKPDQSEVFTRWCGLQESPICQTRILDFVFVWNSDLQYIKEVTGKEGIDNYKEGHHFRRADYASLAKVFGHSIVDSKGESWRWRKKLLLPYFQNNYLASLIPVIQHKFDILSDYVHALGGKEMDIDLFFTEITIEIISHHIWGREISLSSKDLMTHFQHFVLENRNLDSASVNVGFSILLKLQKAVGADKVHSDYITSRDELIRVLTKEIQISRELMNDSIVTEMIKSGSYRTDKELISEVLMLLFAGHDTTAHTMSFLMYLMCHNPDKFELLRKENDEIFEKKGSEPWSPELLGSLPYLTAAMQETLRFYPIAWASSVVALKDTEVGGFIIPKGTELIHNFRAAGLNPKYFNQPESFLPERFLKGSELNNEGSYVFQFNLGPHICLGRNLAYIETRLIISELLRHFDFKIAPDFNLELAILLTLRPLNGVKMIITPRSA